MHLSLSRFRVRWPRLPARLPALAVLLFAVGPWIVRIQASVPTLESDVVRGASVIVPEPGGGIVAISQQPANGGPLTLVRLKPTGEVDHKFNASRLGLLALDSIRLLPSGKFLVAGSFASAGGGTVDRLVKLNSDGSVDTNFAPGAAFAPVPRVRTDGRILLLGSATAAAGSVRPALVRLNPDGSPDTTFHPAAVLVAGSAYDLRLEATDEVLILGLDGAAAGQRSLQRLKDDGALDRKFHPPAAVSGGYGICALALTPDGKLLVAEYADSNDQTCTLNRLEADGSPDPSFQPPAPLQGRIDQLAADAAGHTFFSGQFSEVNGIQRRGFARLNNDGGVDRSFDPLAGSATAFDGFIATPTGDLAFARGLTPAESVGLDGEPGVLLEQLGAGGSSASVLKIVPCSACELVPSPQEGQVFVQVTSVAPVSSGVTSSQALSRAVPDGLPVVPLPSPRQTGARKNAFLAF
jgi:uncharacterized delta-60 repeat protein